MLDKLEHGDRQVVLAALERAERTETELRYLADHDSLTGLLDRRRFRAELDQFVSFSARYGGQGAMMIIDIDGLKLVNDSLGHQAGDNLIRQIAAIMRERVRTTDIVARLSGDEFAVLMPQTDVTGAMKLAEELRAEVAENARPAPEAEAATISVGIAMFGRKPRGSAEGVLVAADQAMYTAKEERPQPDRPLPRPERNAAIAAADQDDDGADPRRPHPQPPRPPHPADPQPHLGRDRALRAAAADGGRGRDLLPAASFIEAAERSGMVQELDRWVVARALELLAAREREGHPVSLHVNLSGVSLTDLSVLEYIERKVDEGGADPSRCTFEITDDPGRGLRHRARVRRPPHRARLPGRDRRLRRQLQPVPPPEAAPVRPDQDRRRVRPRHAAQRRRPADRAGDRPDRPRSRQGDDRRVRPGRRTTEMLREYGVDMAQGFHLGRPVDIAEALAA